MVRILSKDQIEDLVSYCGGTKARWKGDEITFCCPIHGEKNPSCGISSEKQVFNCFACGARGSLAKFLYLSLPDQFGYSQIEDSSTWYKAEIRAWQFLGDRYSLNPSLDSRYTSVERYDDIHASKVPGRTVIPLWKLAQYHSGKFTYEYFFQRGFTFKDMQDFMVGYDEFSKTVTVPVFWEDGALAGVIGRYLYPRSKNERYKVYDGFHRSSLFFPMDKYRPAKDGSCILVEGILDAIKMHSLGYTQTLAIMSDNLSKAQAFLLPRLCGSIVYIGDNDVRGLEARGNNRKAMAGKINEFFMVEYPDYGKDCCDWSPEDIESMVGGKFLPNTRSIRRWYK